MSKIWISLCLSLVAVSANALDVSGITLGSSLEEARKGILAIKKNYEFEQLNMNGVPVAYKAAICKFDPKCQDEIAILQGQGKAVWFVSRFQSFGDPKDRFAVTELVSNLQKKYGKPSTPIDSDRRFVWAFDRSGGQQFGLSTFNSGGNNLGPCNINDAAANMVGPRGSNYQFPDNSNDTCGKYIVVDFSSDGNGFVAWFAVQVVDIAHIADEMNRKGKAADEVQRREAEAQRAKGLKPQL